MQTSGADSKRIGSGRKPESLSARRHSMPQGGGGRMSREDYPEEHWRELIGIIVQRIGHEKFRELAEDAMRKAFDDAQRIPLRPPGAETHPRRRRPSLRDQ